MKYITVLSLALLSLHPLIYTAAPAPVINDQHRRALIAVAHARAEVEIELRVQLLRVKGQEYTDLIPSKIND